LSYPLEDAKSFLPFLVRQLVQSPSDITLMVYEEFYQKIKHLIPQLSTKSRLSITDGHQHN
jgi:hypothetical protein